MLKFKLRCHSDLAAWRRIQPNYCNMPKVLVSILLESGKMKYFQGIEVLKETEYLRKVDIPCEISGTLLEMLHRGFGLFDYWKASKY